MTTDRMTLRALPSAILTTFSGVLAIATLTGCEIASQGDAEGSDSIATDQPVTMETQESVSIIREDIEPLDTPAPPAPLEPLAVRIGFGHGGAELAEEAIEALRSALRSEQMANGGPITLNAHSDSDGSDDANMRASVARGEAVRDWLIENGIAKDRIRLIAFGEQNPAEPNALPDGSPNEAGRVANRRVEMVIAVSGGDASQSDQHTRPSAGSMK